ncbi:hypothetical protein QQ045_010273 [Rhodiola kirilowii]
MMDDEGETILRQEEGNVEEEDQSEGLPNASLLPQLNLAIVVLSMLSSSSPHEEDLVVGKVNNSTKGDFNENEGYNVRATRLDTRRRGMRGCKFTGDRRASSVQSSVRDFRHGKRM